MSTEKKPLLERLLGNAKKKTQDNKSQLETQIKERLKTIVYDDELVEELAPAFLSLHGKEGFDQVLDLLETKEKQIEAISGGDWFKQESDPDAKDESDEESEKQDLASLAESIISKRHGENK